MSYGTDQGFQDWLDQYGYTLPVDAPSLAILRARGSAYIDAAYEPQWTGYRTDFGQDNAWPRTGAKYNCVIDVATDIIPAAVITASYRAAYLEAVTPGVLVGPVQSGPRVKRQKVDVIEREFFDDGSAPTGFRDPTIDGALSNFICADEGAGFFFESIGS